MRVLLLITSLFLICSCSGLKLIESDNEAVNDNSADEDQVTDETQDEKVNDDTEPDGTSDEDEPETEDEDESEESDVDCVKAELTENEKLAVLQIFEEFDSACSKSVNEGGYFEIYHENEMKGFAIASSHYGFDGPVEMMTGIDKDGKILAVAEVSQYESWWFRLGSWFFDQFKEIEISKISLDPRYNDSCWPCTEMYDSFSPYEVDAVSGATISSNAVTKDVWDAIYIYDDLP